MAVGADLHALHLKVVDGHFVHLGDDLLAVVSPRLLHGFEVVGDGAIGAGHGLVRDAVAESLLELRGESAGLVVHVPVAGSHERHALHGVKSDAVHLIDLQAQRDDLLAAGLDAELLSLLDGVCEIGTRIGQHDDLRAAGLGLQQVGREVVGVQRVQHRTQHLSASLRDKLFSIRLPSLAERVVDGDEVELVVALIEHRLDDALSERIRVEHPLGSHRRARLAGQSRRRGAGEHVRLLLFRHHFLDRDRDGGRRTADDGVDAFLVHPLLRNSRANVRLVLVVGDDQLIFLPATSPPKSSIAMRAASTAPGPPLSAYGPDWSAMMPIFTTSPEIWANAAGADRIVEPTRIAPMAVLNL